MKKSTLLRKVSAETGVPYATVKQVVDATLAAVIESLHRGERVVLSGFGTFALRPYRARQWTNPQNGRPVDIPAALRPGFVSSAALKRRLGDTPGRNGVSASTDTTDSAAVSTVARATVARRRSRRTAETP